MTMVDHVTRIEQKDPLDVRMNLGPKLRQAFAELGNAVGQSHHFDQDMRALMEELSRGDKVTVLGFVNAFAVFANETMKHLRATSDPRAEEAWNKVVDAVMDQRPFTLTEISQMRGGGRD